MKKLLFLLGGVVTLTACSEDIYQEAEMQNEETGSQNQINSFNGTDSGYIDDDGVKAPGANYFSPWDIWYNRGYTDQQPSYYFNNGNSENPSPYRLEVYAWVGLAYFDGIDDGKFHDDLNAATPTLVADMQGNLAQYTNLFASGHEVGNLVRTAVPIDLNPLDELRLEDKENHLQMADPFNLGLTPKYSGKLFDFGGALSPDEDILLRHYGKVFFYEVHVFEGGTFVGQYTIHPEINTLPTYSPSGYWEKIMKGTTHVQGHMPLLGGTFDLFYMNHPAAPRTLWDPTTPTGNRCDSHEVVFYLPPSMQLSSHVITGGSVLKTIGMRILAHPFTLWQNSSLNLEVY